MVALINMAVILMMPGKLASVDLLKIKVFKIKVIMTKFLSMTSLTKLFHVTQLIL